MHIVLFTFTARAGVTQQMHEVVCLMLENRPEDPIAFITH